jgi:hypothetical protein
VIGFFLVIQMPDPSDVGRMAVLLRPLDCLALRFEGSEDVVRVVLDNVIIDGVPLGAAFWTRFDVNSPCYSPLLNTLQCSSTYPARRKKVYGPFRSLRARTVARSHNVTSRFGYVAVLCLYFDRALSSRQSRASSRSTPALSPPPSNSATQFAQDFLAANKSGSFARLSALRCASSRLSKLTSPKEA